MTETAHWVLFCLRLLLFVGAASGVTLFGWRVHRTLRVRFLYPALSLAILPFFLSFKVTEVLGKGSWNSLVYSLLSLLLIGIAGSFVLIGKLRLQSHKVLTTLSTHKVFLCLLAILFIFFLWRGLYLEYPGDGISYFQDVGLANQDSKAALAHLWTYNGSQTFFSSLQQWLTGSGPAMREHLVLVATVNRCLLLLATYRTAYWVIRNRTMALVAALLSLGYYGTLQIILYLYKDLQGVTLAMVTYLEAIPLLFAILMQQQRPRWQALLAIQPLFWIMLDNHQEKLLYVITVDPTLPIGTSASGLAKAIVNGGDRRIVSAGSFVWQGFCRSE